MRYSGRRFGPAPILAVLALAIGACAHANAADRRGSGESGPGVTAEQIERAPTVSVEDQMTGRFPGVRIIHLPGGGFSVRMFGPTSLRSSQEPLYVVDGMPVHVDPGRGIDWLNPQDIARIRVLKDVADTAMWGVRGGNGVVIITTKKGRDNG